MCWEDVKINRNSPGRQFTVAVAVTSGVLMGPNPRRTALIIFNTDAGTATVSLSPSAVTGQGVPVTTTSAPVKLPIWEVGSLLQQPISVIGVGATLITVIEVETPLKKDEATRE